MKANPGGQIDPKAVVGRDAVINEIWDTLEQQSIRMTAERRIGKTTILKKMGDEPRSGWRVKFCDLEHVHTANEFAMAVYRDVDEFLTRTEKSKRRATELFRKLGGMEIAGQFTLPKSVGQPWKDILVTSIGDLMDMDGQDAERLLFLWDEMPYMLQNIRDGEGEEIAMQVLDVLRSLRQSHRGFRMIITGSIGLHHVFASLKAAGYANAPVNDMLQIEVPALKLDDACKLAQQLIEGEGLPCEDLETSATAIAHAADCFPYYIHHIVRGLKVGDMPASPKNIEPLVAARLVDSNDPWELRHYSDRIPTYYGDKEKLVFNILDELALQGDALPVDQLLSNLKQIIDFDDRDELIKLLRLLEQDHYLARNTDGHYFFRFPIICRWWKLDRGLESGR